MGRKISVDSATMMNKALEVIEARFLFGLAPERLEVVIHPQSVIHSMVQYHDKSVVAQLGTPDMRTPIAYALAWPERIATPCRRLDLVEIARLEFEAPDPVRFPALNLAWAALRQGGSAPAVLNAANEEAVAAFLSRRIGFLDIAAIVGETLDAVVSAPTSSLEDVIAVDRDARRQAAASIAARTH